MSAFGYLDTPRPVAIAHRGGSLEAEENTLPAFARAVALGYGHVETDVHLTADGEVVIHHDASLLRMTGDPRAIAALTWAELHRVRTHGGARIPRLADLLEDRAASGSLPALALGSRGTISSSGRDSWAFTVANGGEQRVSPSAGRVGSAAGDRRQHAVSTQS